MRAKTLVKSTPPDVTKFELHEKSSSLSDMKDVFVRQWKRVKAKKNFCIEDRKTL